MNLHKVTVLRGFIWERTYPPMDIFKLYTNILIFPIINTPNINPKRFLVFK